MPVGQHSIMLSLHQCLAEACLTCLCNAVAVEKLKAAAVAEAAAAAPPPDAAGDEVEGEGIQQAEGGVAAANGAQAFGLVTLNVTGLQAQVCALSCTIWLLNC